MELYLHSYSGYTQLSGHDATTVNYIVPSGRGAASSIVP